MIQRLYEDLSVFFAHCVYLELEASERLRELAAAMMLHRDHELSDLFEELARNSDLHGAKVENLSENLCTPNLRIWDYTRSDDQTSGPAELVENGSLMSSRDALETALRVEHKAERFYRDIALHTEDQEIRSYATQFAEEEQKHIKKVMQKIEALALNSTDQPVVKENSPDSDSPNSGD